MTVIAVTISFTPVIHVCFKLILYCSYHLFSYIFRDNAPLSTSYEVRVLDLDRPWEAYVVTDSLSGISNLVWDRTGHRLLVTGLDGSCSVWEMEVIYLKKKRLHEGPELCSHHFKLILSKVSNFKLLQWWDSPKSSEIIVTMVLLAKIFRNIFWTHQHKLL